MNKYIKNSLKLILGALIGIIGSAIISVIGIIIFLRILSFQSQGGMFVAVLLGLAAPRIVTIITVVTSIIFLLFAKHRIEKKIDESERNELRSFRNFITIFLIVTIIFFGQSIYSKFGFDSHPVKPPKPEACYKIKDPHYRGLCFHSIISNTRSRDLSVMTEEKRENLAIDICGKIEEDWLRDGCFGELALKSNDSAICRKIMDPFGNEGCKAHTAKELNECDSLNETARMNCFASVAKVKKDISLCNKASYKEDCEAGVYSAIAAENKDISICKNIVRGDLKDSCYADVFIACNDKTACNNITMFTQRSRCLREIGGK